MLDAAEGREGERLSAGIGNLSVLKYILGQRWNGVLRYWHTFRDRSSGAFVVCLFQLDEDISWLLLHKRAEDDRWEVVYQMCCVLVVPPEGILPPWYTPDILARVSLLSQKCQQSQGWAPGFRDLRECCGF